MVFSEKKKKSLFKFEQSESRYYFATFQFYNQEIIILFKQYGTIPDKPIIVSYNGLIY